MLTGTQRAEIRRLRSEGTNISQIARKTGRSRSLVYKILEESPAHPVTAPPSAVPPEGDRAGVGRQRLWEVLNDPHAPHAATVAAFNALAESEQWSAPKEVALPEPKTEDEAVARFAALVESFEEPLQARLVAVFKVL